MNTDIGDAVKLAAVVHGRARGAPQPLRAGARRLRAATVTTTDQVFKAVTSRGPIVRRVRLNLVPLLFPRLFALSAIRRFMFLTISQTAVHYRGSSLSVRPPGQIHGGGRLPWVPPDSQSGEDNFTASS